MSFNVFLEDLIKTLGGFGRYQIILCIVINNAEMIVVWTILQMVLNGAAPEWWCNDVSIGHNFTGLNATIPAYQKTCTAFNKTCSDFAYDNSMHTLVSEWDLVCDEKWIPATLTTVQFAGILVGNFVAGHFADAYGRKPTFFLGLAALVVLNVIAIFSVSWLMYVVIRLLMGIAMGFELTVHNCIQFEFIRSKWRPIVASIPCWSFQSGLFALTCYLLHDWKLVHVATAAVGFPFLFAWWTTPESFRWLVTKGKLDEAQKVLQNIAKWNRKAAPNLETFRQRALYEIEATENEKGKRHYTVIDLFRGAKIAKKSICLCMIWFATGFTYYCITFGVEAMSGNLYLNLFLVTIIEMPGILTIMFLTNWIGRKKTCFMYYTLSGVAAVVVGVLQLVDNSGHGSLKNGFALVSKLGVSCAWAALVILSTEIYPTVVRNVSFGMSSVAARIGAMLAPQIVFLNTSVPGLLYLMSAATMIISGLICFVFKETKGQALTDTLKTVDVELPVANGYSCKDEKCDADEAEKLARN